jgi:hypothetical protein
MSSVTGTKRVYKPSTTTLESFARVHCYANGKTFSPLQSQAIKSFSRIEVSWIQGQYEWGSTRAEGIWKVARAIALKLQPALLNNSRGVGISLYLSCLSPNGQKTADKHNKLTKWAEEFTRKKLRPRIV